MNTPMLKVPLRDFHHNLSNYLKLAQVKPLVITKYGKDEAVLVNPDKFQIAKKKKSKSLTQKLKEIGFIGMHKDRPDWEGKTNQEIAEKLRHVAWYGK